LGLVAFDLMPGAKALLARHTMGTAGRLPRLARGLDLPKIAAPAADAIAAKAAPTKKKARTTPAKAARSK
jgi:hypothetical protein